MFVLIEDLIVVGEYFHLEWRDLLCALNERRHNKNNFFIKIDFLLCFDVVEHRNHLNLYCLCEVHYKIRVVTNNFKDIPALGYDQGVGLSILDLFLDPHNDNLNNIFDYSNVLKSKFLDVHRVEPYDRKNKIKVFRNQNLQSQAENIFKNECQVAYHCTL